MSSYWYVHRNCRLEQELAFLGVFRVPFPVLKENSMNVPNRIFGIVCVCVGLAAFGVSGCAPSSLAYLTLDDARIVNKMHIDGKYEASMADGAAGIAILDLTTVGVGFGMTAGHGVVVAKSGDGWSSPVPVDVISGSVGLQLGGQNAKVMMIFRTQEAFDAFVFNESSFVAEASGTAGSKSDSAGSPLKSSDVTVISQIGGLYGGAVIGGISVTINKDLMKKSYGDGVDANSILGGSALTPAGADSLWKALKG